jgi:hypothetical protein
VGTYVDEKKREQNHLMVQRCREKKTLYCGKDYEDPINGLKKHSRLVGQIVRTPLTDRRNIQDLCTINATKLSPNIFML